MLNSQLSSDLLLNFFLYKNTPNDIIPANTMGSFCFLFDHLLFSGDTLFYRGIGRTDLKGGEYVLLSVF